MITEKEIVKKVYGLIDDCIKERRKVEKRATSRNLICDCQIEVNQMEYFEEN